MDLAHGPSAKVRKVDFGFDAGEGEQHISEDDHNEMIDQHHHDDAQWHQLEQQEAARGLTAAQHGEDAKKHTSIEAVIQRMRNRKRPESKAHPTAEPEQAPTPQEKGEMRGRIDEAATTTPRLSPIVHSEGVARRKVGERARQDLLEVLRKGTVNNGDDLIQQMDDGHISCKHMHHRITRGDRRRVTESAVGCCEQPSGSRSRRRQ